MPRDIPAAITVRLKEIGDVMTALDKLARAGDKAGISTLVLSQALVGIDLAGARLMDVGDLLARELAKK